MDATTTEPAPDNVVPLVVHPAAPEQVSITLEKSDVVRMLLGTDPPWAPASPLITFEKDLIRGREYPTWNRKALEGMPLQSLLQIYSDINWTKETNEHIGAPLAIVAPR